MSSKIKNYTKTVLWPAVKIVFKNYFEHNVSKNAAALAYYLLFTFFPLLIFVSNLLGVLELDSIEIVNVLNRILPSNVIELVEDYLEYVKNTSSMVLLSFSLVFSVWFPMRAVKGLMYDVRRAYGLKKPKKPIAYTIRRLTFSVVFLLTVVLTLLLSTVGKKILGFFSGLLPDHVSIISHTFIEPWQYLRFLLIALLMLSALGVLYSMSLDERQPPGSLVPGILLSSVTWMVTSIGFSFYVENFSNYSVIYGALGAIIVLLMWLYLTANILIIGAEFNAALITVRKNNMEQ